MKNKKKIIVLSVMVVLLVASAFLNVWLNSRLGNSKPGTGDTPNVTATFNSFRSDRTTGRLEMFDYLDAIMISETSSAEAKVTAEAQKQKICDLMEGELKLENLIKAKGFSDALVNLTDDSCTITVVDDDLQANEVAQILAIILTETKYLATQVNVNAY